jgi:hypothetical protein
MLLPCLDLPLPSESLQSVYLGEQLTAVDSRGSLRTNSGLKCGSVCVLICMVVCGLETLQVPMCSKLCVFCVSAFVCMWVLCILGHRISICVFMLIHIKYLSNFIG